MSSQERVALITGGSRGIGAATARLLAARGNKVVINYLQNEVAAQQLVAEIQAVGGEARAIQANVQDAQQIEHLVKSALDAYGHIDILVSNAPSHYTFKPLLHLTSNEFVESVADELKAAFELTRAVAPQMIEQRYGRLVYVASGLAKQPGFSASISLGTAKAALVHFVRYVAQELGPYDITANTVSPGMVETDLSSTMPEEIKQSVIARTPLRRIAQPEDIAHVIAFFTSDESAFMTGVYSPVNGGMAMD